VRSSWAVNPQQGRGDHSARHTHIHYSEGWCEYRFDDGERCVWRGRLLDGICAEHRDVVRAREDQRQRRDRRRRDELWQR
jgi:hypothetical protein